MKHLKSILITLVLVFTITTIALAGANTISLYSDTSVMVYGPLDEYKPLNDPAWGSPIPAVITWKHPSWPTISNAEWISNSYYIEKNIAGNTWRKFSKTADLCDNAYNVYVTINATADNAEEVYVNGYSVGSDGEVQGSFIDNHEWSTIVEYYNIPGNVDAVTIDFIVRNYSGTNSATGNPTGLIFDSKITYDCPVEVDIDIKPGSYPSCFNNDGSGIIPVAINGSADFDVYTVNTGSVTLEGLSVAAKGKSDKLMAAYEDWNGDGYMDLVLKIVDVDDTFTKGSGTAALNGFLNDGTPFFGIGDICITQ